MKYFNVAEVAKSQALEGTFLGCKVAEDIWKIDLCSFVDGVLFGLEPRGTFQREMLSILENTDFFFKLHWGRWSFESTLKRVNKYMLRLRDIYLKKSKEKVLKEKEKVHI